MDGIKLLKGCDCGLVLGGYEHEIAKSLAGLGEDPMELLQAMLADIRDYQAQFPR